MRLEIEPILEKVEQDGQKGTNCLAFASPPAVRRCAAA